MQATRANWILILPLLLIPTVSSGLRESGTRKKCTTAGLIRQEQRVRWSFSRVVGSDRFVIKAENLSGKRVAITRYWPLYEVRLFDKDGKKLTNFVGYLATSSMFGPQSCEW